MPERLFTIEEANGLIPRLELIMGKLQRQSVALREELTELARQSGEPLDQLTTAQLIERRPQLHPLVEEMETLLRELHACDVQLKGLDMGLIDFPAEIDGERVLLCWQYGEKELSYYHSPDAGFAGRKPLGPDADQPRLLQ